VKDDPAEEDPKGPAAEARICTRSDVAAQYEQHHKKLREVAERFFEGKRPDAAENAVMDVFLRLSKLAGEGETADQGDGWAPYLRRAVRNSCIDIVRKEKKERERFPEGDPKHQRIIDADPLGDAVVADRQARQRIARLKPALANLDENELAIIRHKFWDEWTDRKIGDALGTSGQAVGQRLKTILKRLHEEVTKGE
jgi:RNA polymerase sigma factor (sigma-70 family)